MLIKRKIIYFIICILFLTSVLFIPINFLLADNVNGEGQDQGLRAKIKDYGKLFGVGAGFEIREEESANVYTLVGGAINVATSFIGAIFLILIIYAGFLWMTAGGNQEQIAKAKKIMSRAVIGVILLVSAYIITYIILIILEYQTIA
jgi:hypothetical protein